MKEKGIRKPDSPGAKIWILAVLAILCIGLEIGVHLFLRTAIGYTHIFYLLLVLVTSKLRLVNASGVFLAVEKGLDPLLLTQLTTYVDNIIDMDTANPP